MCADIINHSVLLKLELFDSLQYWSSFKNQHISQLIFGEPTLAMCSCDILDKITQDCCTMLVGALDNVS